MKKIISILLTLSIFFAMLPTSASAAEVLTGSCGKGVSYTLNLDTKTLMVTGKGEIDWFPDDEDNSMDIGKNYWWYYQTQIETVIVGEGITLLEEYSFAGFSELTRVELPESLTTIGLDAFQDCVKLQEIQLPSHLKVLGSGAFSYCSSLKTLTLPKSLTLFAYDAVNNFCSSLTAINVMDGNSTYTSRDGVLFSKDGRILVCYPPGKTEQDYTVPAEVQYIGLEAFHGCKAIRTVHSTGSVRKIGRWAFNGCESLESVILGSEPQDYDPKSFFEGIFYGCNKLREVYYDYDPYFFQDVKENTYYTEAIEWAAKKGIATAAIAITGRDDDRFLPNDDCMRQDIVTFLWRTMGSAEMSGEKMPFVDVMWYAYYYDATLWAVKNGVTKGVNDTHFAPYRPCTRAQAVTFLWRCAGEPKAEGATTFTDVKEGSFYYDAVCWAAENNITKGVSENTFSPNTACTRGQVITFLYRCFGDKAEDSSQ